MATTVYMIIIGFYCLVMIGLGIYGKQKTPGKTLNEYFLAGRSIGPVVAFFALGATIFSPVGLQGAPANFAKNGVGNFIFAIVTLVEGYLFYLYAFRFNILGRKFDYITLGDYMEHRYGGRLVRWVFGGLQLILTIPYIAIQLTAFGNLMENFSGGQVSFALGALILGVVMMIYIFIGGYRSVAWTNVIQGILMILALLLSALLLLRHIDGGFAGMMMRKAQNAPETLTVPGQMGAWPRATWFAWLFFMFAMCTQPHVVQKFFSSRDTKSIRFSILMLPVYGILVYIAACLFGWAGQELIPDQLKSVGDGMTMALVIQYLPVWIGGIFACGIIAAAMSTADSQYITVGSLVTKDFIQSSRQKKTRDAAKDTRLGQMIVLILFVVGYFIAIMRLTSIVGLITKGIFPFGSQLFVAMLGGLYWRKATKEGTLVSLIGGLILVSLMTFGGLHSPLGFHPILWSLLLNLILYIVVSLATYKEENAASYDAMLAAVSSSAAG